MWFFLGQRESVLHQPATATRTRGVAINEMLFAQVQGPVYELTRQTVSLYWKELPCNENPWCRSPTNCRNLRDERLPVLTSKLCQCNQSPWCRSPPNCCPSETEGPSTENWSGEILAKAALSWILPGEPLQQSPARSDQRVSAVHMHRQASHHMASQME